MMRRTSEPSHHLDSAALGSGEHRPRVAMLLSNGYDPDVRAQMEAHILAVAGYHVTVIAWDRSLSFPVQTEEEIPVRFAAALADWPGRSVERPEPVSIVRIRVAANYNTGRRLLPKIPGFWWGLFQAARRARPAVIHAHQLDTLPVAYVFGRQYGVPVVYDAREYYAGMIQASAGRPIGWVLERLDRWLTPRASAVLTVGERHAARHAAMGGRVSIVHNSQPRTDIGAAMREGRAFRRSLQIPDAALLVTYVGNLSADRLLTPVLQAVPRMDGVWLVVGGDGLQTAEVQAAAAACPRILALGRVPLDQVGTMVAAADVVYYGLNDSVPNSFYFMPNLSFFAFAAGRPLLVTPVGEIADVVRRTKCGLVMEAATGAAAEEALRQLRDDAFRASLAAQARHLAHTEFDMLHAATRLVDAYANVRAMHRA